ncbi:beta-lactamase family protein [Microbacteriaceae bacterium VKM Ac-2855]|nr:beta-lactamase family protein [Microbacteriaceae bacterium VKM Ac-2855]
MLVRSPEPRPSAAPARGRRRLIRALAGAAIAAVALAGCSGPGNAVDVAAAPSGTVPDAVGTELGGYVEQARNDAKATGVIAGVWAPWLGSWETAVGTTQPDGGTALTTDMHFRLGSGGTQAMTCQILAGLAADGVIVLDDPVTTYVPSMPGLDGITMRQLCNHTSGLSDFATALWPTYLDNPVRQWPTLELVSAAQVHSPANAPGALWTDSDTGPLLAALAMSATTSRSWDSLADEYVTGRYSLSDTRIPAADATELPAPHPGGYAFDVDSPGGAPACDRIVDVSTISSSALGAAGGAVTTLSDLRRMVAGMAASPTGPEAWAEVPIEGSPEWRRGALAGTVLGPMHGFSGSMPGFLTAAYSDPDSGLTVAVTMNNSTAGDGLAEEVAKGLAAIAVEAGAAAGAEGLPVLNWSGADQRAAIDARRVC